MTDCQVPTIRVGSICPNNCATVVRIARNGVYLRIAGKDSLFSFVDCEMIFQVK